MLDNIMNITAINPLSLYTYKQNMWYDSQDDDWPTRIHPITVHSATKANPTDSIALRLAEVSDDGLHSTITRQLTCKK